MTSPQPPPRGDRLVVLRPSTGRSVGKIYTPTETGWTRRKLTGHRHFSVEVAPLAPDFEALRLLLRRVLQDDGAFLLRDAPETAPSGPIRRLGEHFPERASRFLPLDFDGVPLAELELQPGPWVPGADPRADAQVVEAVRRRYLPEPFWRVPAIGVLSASTGWTRSGAEHYTPIKAPPSVSLHIWFILDRPLEAEVLRSWCRVLAEEGAPVDANLYNRAQPIYCGAPIIRGTLPASAPPLLRTPGLRIVPLPGESGDWLGGEADRVPAEVILAALAQLPPAAASAPSAPRLRAGAVLAEASSDEHLRKRIEGAARGALSGALERLQSLTDASSRHRRVYSEAKRLAGFAAEGLLDWVTVCDALAEAGRTSGVQRALRHAEANPDDVSGYLQGIIREHREKQRRSPPSLRRRPRLQAPSPLLGLREARTQIRGLVASALAGTLATVLYLPPGIGKTTAILRFLGRSTGLYLYAAPTRQAAAEAVQRLRSHNRRAEIWLGKAGPSLLPSQPWQQPGMQADGETVETCANEHALGRIRKGYRAFCGGCPRRDRCSEGSDSLQGGYQTARRLALQMMREGDGVIVITQDLLSAALSQIRTLGASLAGVCVDEQPRLQSLSLSRRDLQPLASLRTPEGEGAAAASALSDLLRRVAAASAEEDRARLADMTPPQRAMLQAHGRIISSRYQVELRTLGEHLQPLMPALERAEGEGFIPRSTLQLLQAVCQRPESITLSYTPPSDLGSITRGPVDSAEATLATLADPPSFPAGVPVLVADATASKRRIEAWVGRPVRLEAVRLSPHRHIRALLVDSKGLQRGRLGEDHAPEIAARLDRLGAEIGPELAVLERKRGLAGLKLSALIVAPKRLIKDHASALGALIGLLESRGWTVHTTHWQGTESRGSDKYNGVGLLITLGSPRINLTGWAVQERALSAFLGEPPPPDEASSDSRTRVRWQEDATAEIWQAHGRARSFTDPEERPTLHVSVAPLDDQPRALSTLPDRQREHKTLNGRPADAALWLENTIAELDLCAVHPGLLSKLDGAPSFHTIRSLCRTAYARPRRWGFALTGGGKTTRYALARDGARAGEVAASLNRIAEAAGLQSRVIESPYRAPLSTSDHPPRPPRPQRRQRRARSVGCWVDAAGSFSAPPTLADEGEPPPVKANHANEGPSPAVLDSRAEEDSPATSKEADPPPLPS